MENKKINNNEYIDKMLIENELMDLKEYIYQNIKNSIKITTLEEEDYSEVGSTRIAGYPDVPDGFIWPKTKDGEFMTFIAQLNMIEISKYDVENILPKQGILYFFIGRDEPAYDIEHKVIYIEHNENIKLMEIEETTILEDDYKCEFKPFKASANSSLDIPNYAYMDYDIIDNSDSYFDMQEQIKGRDNNYIGCISGYPEGQHDDVELEAALKIILNENYNYSLREKDKLIKYFNGDMDKTDEEINNIYMLLEINSDSKVGFQWWDCGYIHFFIRKEDLINKDFNRTYLSLYSS